MVRALNGPSESPLVSELFDAPINQATGQFQNRLKFDAENRSRKIMNSQDFLEPTIQAHMKRIGSDLEPARF